MKRDSKHSTLFDCQFSQVKVSTELSMGREGEARKLGMIGIFQS